MRKSDGALSDATTVWPISGGIPGASPGIAPGGGGGGAGGMPLEIWIVMIDPGIVCPLGDVPTTDPYDDVLFTLVESLATWKPASRSRRAARKGPAARSGA